MSGVRGLAQKAFIIAIAVPAMLLAAVLRLVRRNREAEHLSGPSREVSSIIVLVTAVLWGLVTWRGILYPITDGSNLNNSWGGPTLAGAWVTHLAIALAVLFAICLVLAMVQPATRADRTTA